MPHLNNIQNKKTNPIISRQNYHLTQPCPTEEKQTNKTVSPYMKLTQITGPTLGGQKPKEERIQLSSGKEVNLKSGKRRSQTQ